MNTYCFRVTFNKKLFSRSRDSAGGTATALRAAWSGVRISAQARYFVLLKNAQTAPGPITLPIQGVTAFSPGNAAAGE
jgi:hypothetical protein